MVDDTTSRKMATPPSINLTHKTQQAAKGVIYTILLRLLSFILTQITIRFADPKSFGHANIKLELLCSSTVLFLGREGFRLGLLRVQVEQQQDDNNGSTTALSSSSNSYQQRYNRQRRSQINNVSWLSVPTCLLLTLIALHIHLTTITPNDFDSIDSNTNNTNHINNNNNAYWDYKLSGILYCLATIIESLSEPFLIPCLQTLDVTTRAKAEGVANIGKAASSVLLFILLERRNNSNQQQQQQQQQQPLFITLDDQISNHYWWWFDSSFVSSMIIYLPGPITIFGISQCVYSILLFCILFHSKRKEVYWPTWLGSTTTTTDDDNDNIAQRPNNTTSEEKDIISSSINRVNNNNNQPKRWFTLLSILRSYIYNNFDMSTLTLSIYFTLQSIVKHLLTEGDRIILATLVASYDSGVYAMASSYGSMAARLIFQPLEENGRLLFSNQHSTWKKLVIERYNSNNNNNDQHQQQQQQKKTILRLDNDKTNHEIDSNTNSNSSIDSSINIIYHDMILVYQTLLKLVTYIGLIFATFGSNYTTLLLQILAGERWSSNPEASKTLSAFCFYTAFLALNGMSEAFVYGVADTSQDVKELSILHSVIGVVFYVMAPIMVLYGDSLIGIFGDGSGGGGGGGTVALVFANCLCMALRSVYSLSFAVSYFDIVEFSTSSRTMMRTNNTTIERKMRWTIKHWKSVGKMMSCIIPKFHILLFFIASNIITRHSLGYTTTATRRQKNNVISLEVGLHVSIGICCLLCTMIAAYKSEKSLFMTLKQIFQQRSNNKTVEYNKSKQN